MNIESLKLTLSKYDFQTLESIHSECLAIKDNTFLNIYRSNNSVQKSNEAFFFVSCIFNILEDMGEEDKYNDLGKKCKLYSQKQVFNIKNIQKHFKGTQPNCKASLLIKTANSKIIFGIEFENKVFLLLKDTTDTYAVLGISIDLLIE